jgi:hypothetical protein
MKSLAFSLCRRRRTPRTDQPADDIGGAECAVGTMHRAQLAGLDSEGFRGIQITREFWARFHQGRAE